MPAVLASQAAEEEGYGKSAKERMNEEEKVIAKDVARKLAPLVVCFFFSRKMSSESNSV